MLSLKDFSSLLERERVGRDSRLILRGPGVSRPTHPILSPCRARFPLTRRGKSNMRKMDPSDFWGRVDKTEDCWLWSGCISPKGHGLVSWRVLGGSNIPASRVSWVLTNGPVPDGFKVSRSCCVKLCVNPSHLYLAPSVITDVTSAFWERVNKGETCWTWRGPFSPFGYGTFKWQKLPRGVAHRLSWELLCGPIPDGLFVLHHCDNPPCVRPDHLFLGTAQDNMDDCSAKGRRPAGERNHLSTHTLEQAKEVIRLHRQGVKQKDIARIVGINNVSKICSGQIWKEATEAMREVAP